MGKNTGQKPETTKLPSKRDDMTIILELEEEYEKLMGKKIQVHDSYSGIIPRGMHIDYINA